MVSYKAKYGAGRTFKDVTSIVQKKLVKNNKIVLEKGIIFNKYFGDPVPGAIKTLIVTVGKTTYKIKESGNYKKRVIDLPKVLTINDSKVGVVITTHGNHGFYVKQCIESYLRVSKNFFIVLYVNESKDPITLKLKEEFPMITYIYISNQNKNGGLTGTWNQGIKLCLNHGCDTIILSNDDILFDSSIKHIIAASQRCPKNSLKYFGPVTNKPGPAECNLPQKSLGPIKKSAFLLKHKGKYSNINGFFMVFPKHVLIKNKFSDKFYFDPKYPFGGNETEWFERFIKKGGVPVVIPKTFVYHYKNACWRPNQKVNKMCIFTINLGGYESRIAFNAGKYDVDCLYYTDNFKNIYNCIKNSFIPVFVDLKGKSSKLRQRIIKTSPHLYLPSKYDTSLYIDGNITPTFKSITKFLKTYDVDKYKIICFKHRWINNIKTEMQVVIDGKLASKSSVNTLAKKMQKDKFKDNGGHSETGYLLRKHKEIIPFSTEWTQCINICHRDQISFDYLLWKHKIKYKRYSNPPFKVNKHSGNTKNRYIA